MLVFEKYERKLLYVFITLYGNASSNRHAKGNDLKRYKNEMKMKKITTQIHTQNIKHKR